MVKVISSVAPIGHTPHRFLDLMAEMIICVIINLNFRIGKRRLLRTRQKVRIPHKFDRYHPDKNPDALEYFTHVTKSYEILRVGHSFIRRTTIREQFMMRNL